MSNASGGQGCPVKCWSVAGVIGVLTMIILLTVAGKGVMASLILGLLVALLLGLLFNWLFCAPVPAIGASKAIETNASGAAVAVGAGGTVAVASAAGGVTAVATGVGGAAVATAGATTDAAADDSAVKPSAALSGEDELAERKGDWRYEGGDAAAAQADGATADAAPKADTSTDAKAEAGSAADAATSGSVVKPSTPLAGQAELAERKGTWRYEGGDKPTADDTSTATATTDTDAKAKAAKAEPATTPAPAPAADLGEDYDKDGVKEGTEEGSKPALLDTPREGGPDNLKEIKGIGPKLEKVCHSLGVYHFSQIAAWSDDEVAWANANLVGFKGRVTRDNWVEQAKILAAGGDTEFSKRVDKGGVY